MKFLHEKNSSLQKIGVIAKKGEFVSGIRNQDEMYEVGHFKKNDYHEIIEVDTNESIDETLNLIRKCAIPAGPTSGACLAGALKYLKEIDKSLNSPKTAVFIACDRME